MLKGVLVTDESFRNGCLKTEHFNENLVVESFVSRVQPVNGAYRATLLETTFVQEFNFRRFGRTTAINTDLDGVRT